jgi:hypothetical protein
MNGWTADREQQSLELLNDLQVDLCHVLNSIGGKRSEGLSDNYKVYSAGYVNQAAEGFIYLRNAGRIDSSKLLIRPAMEMMIKLQAVHTKPELLFRIAYSEMLDDRKWFKPATLQAGQPYDLATDEKRWSDFKDKYKAQFPAHKLDEKKLTLMDAAEAAGLKGYYNIYYRMYCKYTHAALRAVGGYLNELADPEDNRTMALCVFATLEALIPIGGASPNFNSLQERMRSFDEPN